MSVPPMQDPVQHPERARQLAALAVVIGLLLAIHGAFGDGATAAAATTAPVKLTALHAGISYQGGQGTMPVWTDIRVSITRNGTVILAKAPLPAVVSKSFYKAPVMQVFDFDDDAEPEVLVDVATIGADCCKRSVVYFWNGKGYSDTVMNWGETTYTLKNVVPGVGPEFVTTDARVPTAFHSKQDGPLRVLQLRHGVFVDVTAKAKKLVAKDATLQARAWKKAKGSAARASLAAYVVDLLRLGKTAQARSAIATGGKRHQLGTTPAKFARSLGTRAARWGYVKHSPLG